MKKTRRLVALSMAFMISASVLPGRSIKANTLENYESASGSKPNIVFMLVDDMGYTDTSLYGSGYYETPNLERLADEGIMFTDAYSGSNLCSPSRATILTGRYSTRNGVDRLCQQNEKAYETGENPTELESQSGYLVSPEPTFLPHDEITIPELLKEGGYTSAHIGKWHLGDPERGYGPIEQGYDVNIGGYHRGQPPTYFDPYRIPTLENRNQGEYLTDRLTDEAVQFIRDNKDGPFFLNLSHYAVHTPLEGKADLVEKYRNKPKTENHKNPTYAAMVESVDDSLGRIMDTLEELGIDDNTIVVFTSDNGGIHYWDVSSNKPLREGKCYNYEGGNRIPAVISWKGKIDGGQVNNTPIHHSDYFPTFADVAGVELPTDRVIDGKNILPMLTEGEKLEDRSLYWYNPHFNPDSGVNIVPAAAIRDGDYKLIRHFEESNYADGKLELFNLKEDISESNNLVETMPEKAEELNNKLQKWLNETDSVIPVKKTASIEEALKIPQGNMTAKATTEELVSENSPASKAIDGNPNSIWHSKYTDKELPHSITIDLGDEYKINKVSYLPRQDSGGNGRITSYKLYVSSDGENYNHVATGNWDNNNLEKIIEFNSTEARYVKLRAIGAVNNFVSAAEINVFKSPEVSSIDKSEALTIKGLEPMMPEIVIGQTTSGDYIELNVNWEEISEDKYNTVGEFTIEGNVAGSEVKAECTVKVEEKPIAKDSLVSEVKLFEGKENDILLGTEGLNISEEVTLEFDVLQNNRNGQWQNLIGKIDDEGNGFQVNISPKGKLVFHGEGAITPDNLSNPWRTLESKDVIPLNEKTNVRIAFSSKMSRVRLYINDELQVEKRVYNPLGENNNPIVIGANLDSKNSFNGTLSNIKIYNKFIIDKDVDVFEDGDINKDGKVDLSDLSIISKNYGKAIAEYDIDGDGFVGMYEVNYVSKKMLNN